MKERSCFGMALILGMVIFAADVTGQGSLQHSKNPRDWINYGDNLWRSGSPQAAVAYYNYAHYYASYAYEPYSMVDLAIRYLMLRNEAAALDSYARAKSYAYYWMNRDPARGQQYGYGRNALQYLVNNYNSTLHKLAASQQTQQQLRAQAIEANNVVAAQTRSAQQAPTTGQPSTPGGRGSQGQPSGPGSSGIPHWDDLPIVPYSPRSR
jgi:hypothetical protein